MMNTRMERQAYTATRNLLRIISNRQYKKKQKTEQNKKKQKSDASSAIHPSFNHASIVR